jgi:hypothetical protein
VVGKIHVLHTHREDMRGTGNINRESRTLYIGGLKMLRGTAATHQTLLRHLSEVDILMYLSYIKPSQSTSVFP